MRLTVLHFFAFLLLLLMTIPFLRPSFAQSDVGERVEEEILTSKEKLQASLEEYAKGDKEEAYKLARSAYLDHFEIIEPFIRPLNPDLVLELELQYAEVRSLIRNGAPLREVSVAVKRIFNGLERLSRFIEGPGLVAPLIMFTLSFSIIFREALEAALIIGAVVAYLESTRNYELKKHVYGGATLAIPLTIGTWFAAQFFIILSGIGRELIEAGASILATATLFYLSFWVLTKIESKRWMEFVRAKVWQATMAGKTLVLGILAFTVVYREGFETVLLYLALFGLAEGIESWLATGFVVGLGSIFILLLLIFRLGVKLPLRRLFVVIVALSSFLSIAFIGSAIRELQQLDLVPTTSLLHLLPRVNPTLADVTGFHPTLETLLAQAALAVIYLLGALYVLVYGHEGGK